MRSIAALVLIFLAAFTGTAVAAEAAAVADPSMSELAKSIFEAVMSGQWWVAASYGVILGTIGMRKLMPASWKTGVKGDIIGTATAFVVAFAGALITTMAAPGAAMTGAVALTALKVGALAIGGYTVIHKIVGWLAAWDVLPAWAMSALRMIAMLVGSNAVKKAEAAGDAAVAAKPPTGLAGDTKVTEIE